MSKPSGSVDERKLSAYQSLDIFWLMREYQWQCRVHIWPEGVWKNRNGNTAFGQKPGGYPGIPIQQNPFHRVFV